MKERTNEKSDLADGSLRTYLVRDRYRNCESICARKIGMLGQREKPVHFNEQQQQQQQIIGLRFSGTSV